MDISTTSATPPGDEIAALKAQVSARDALIAILEEKLRLAAHQRFAPTSEKLASLDQMNLFNEAEAASTPEADPAPATETIVPEHKRPRGKRKPIDATLPRLRVVPRTPSA